MTQRCEDAVVLEGDGLDRLSWASIVNTASPPQAYGDRVRDLGTIGLQRVGLLLTAVVDRTW